MKPSQTSVSVELDDVVASSAHILSGSTDDYDPLLKMIGDARIVMLGEASHGTQEFYRERARITKRLIVEKDFTSVAVEADWPDAYRVNRYVTQQKNRCTTDTTSEQALGGFKRFPSWMWRNTEVATFIDWLRAYNDTLLPQVPAVGFYGIDLYSLFTSIEEVLHYLDKVDPEAASRARSRYACFDHFKQDSQGYGYASGLGLSQPCTEVVVAQLRDLCARRADYMSGNGIDVADAYFYAEQNARLIVNAEQYYRTMFREHVSSWNLRDWHMADTLDALMLHHSKTRGQAAKIVVWEHNSHIGDARATEIGQQGELSVGQLMRERHGKEVILVGMTTYQGTVTAASSWGSVAERKRVRPALDDSVEAMFHRIGIRQFMLPLRSMDPVAKKQFGRQLERAIGVIYHPATERKSHYFYTRLPQQFDAVLHFDITHALTPLELGTLWKTGEAPETYPVGI